MTLHRVPDWVLEHHQKIDSSGGQNSYEMNEQMVDKGHPLAGEFQRIWTLYEELPYFAGRYSRYYSVKDKDNLSILTAPSLQIQYDINKDRLKNVLEWHTINGWHQTDLYNLIYGSWAIRTTAPDLVRAAQAVGMVINQIDASGYTELHRLHCDAASFEAIRRLVNRYHAGYLLVEQQPSPQGKGWGNFQEKLLDDLRALNPGQDAWI